MPPTHSAGRSILLTLATLAISVSACAPNPTGDAALVARIDSMAQAEVDSDTTASVAIGVMRGADVVLARGYGQADLELDVPATAETVYRIGSITKQFTSTAIMQLVERGQISLDDEITKFFPDYPTQGHRVTIHHLLTHTSGIKSYTSIRSSKSIPTRPACRRTTPSRWMRTGTSWSCGGAMGARAPTAR